MPYAAGDLYCRTRRCPRLHAQRARIQRVDDPDGEPCPVHIGDANENERSAEELIEDGVCPWCPPDDRYEGDHVGQHASSAHSEAWSDYQDASE